MTQLKFYRVETLPETGEVGSLYFVYGSGGEQALLCLCVGNGLFETYTPEHQDISGKVDVADFEEATLVTSAALNYFNLELINKDTEIKLLQTLISELQENINTSLSNLDIEIIFSGAYGTHVLGLLGLVRKPQVTYNIVDKTLYCESDSVIDSTLIFIGGETNNNTLIL